MDQNKPIKVDDVIAFSTAASKRIFSDGEYNFTVIAADPMYYTGGKVIPACQMILVSLEIQENGVKQQIKERIYLHESAHWKIKSFLLSVGLIDETTTSYKMDWPSVIGLKGTAKITQNRFTSRNGNEVVVNKVAAFLPKSTFEIIELPDEVELDKLPFK